MKKDREYMLNVVWRSIPEYQPQYRWRDGSTTYFYKGVKIEDLNGEKEMYSLISDMYKIMPTHAVWYAYENGIQALSEAIRLTVYSDRLNNQKTQLLQATQEDYSRKIQKLLSNGAINLNQIKEKYEQQRTTDKPIQEV